MENSIVFNSIGCSEIVPLDDIIETKIGMANEVKIHFSRSKKKIILEKINSWTDLGRITADCEIPFLFLK